MAERARLAGALATLALLAPATVLATSTPAAAERAVLTDPAGDVVRTVIDEDGESDATFDTTDAGTDVRRLVVRHAARKITLTMQVRDLERGSASRSASFMLEAPGSRMLLASVDIGQTRAGDHAAAFPVSGNAGKNPRPCRGVRSAVSTQDDTIAITIPRRCLGSPRWIRAGGSVVSGDGAGAPAPRREPGFSFSHDHAGADGRRAFSMPGMTRRLRVG